MYLKCATFMEYFPGRFDARYVSFFSLALIDIDPSLFKYGGYVTDSPTYPPSFRYDFHENNGVIEPWSAGAGIRAGLGSISLFRHILPPLPPSHPLIHCQILRNVVQQEGTNPGLAVDFELFCFVLLSNIRHGIYPPLIRHNSAMLYNAKLVFYDNSGI
jgi:hypothetical protein